jgi:hypothetical protein
VAKKGLLDVSPGAEAAQFAAGGDDAMTRNEKRHRIAPACLPNRPNCAGPSEPGGNLSIGRHLTGGNLTKAGPHSELEGSSLEIDGMIEGPKLAGEVSLEGGNGRDQGAAIFPELNGAVTFVEVSECAAERLPPEKLATADPLL